MFAAPPVGSRAQKAARGRCDLEDGGKASWTGPPAHGVKGIMVLEAKGVRALPHSERCRTRAAGTRLQSQALYAGQFKAGKGGAVLRLGSQWWKKKGRCLHSG